MLYARASRSSSLRTALALKINARHYSLEAASSSNDDRPRRSYLYVPSSSERMLQKSLETPSDVIIYDLEDSVAPAAKPAARAALTAFLSRRHERPLPDPPRVAVRLNAIGTPFFEEDLRAAIQVPHIHTLVLPKIHTATDLDLVSELIASGTSGAPGRARMQPVRIVASMESARAVWDVGNIAAWKALKGAEAGGVLTALLFAAEDYCADTSIIRTLSRSELLYTRSRIALAAKAHGLEAIDMVCVNYKDAAYLREECEDGRRLGFDGKQAIHPTQVEVIHRTFVPTEKEILRAAKIVSAMAASHAEMRGAFGLELGDGSGGREMIDAPMLKQAENVLRVARAAQLIIPDVQVH
ncbi:hypothetical protein M0805_008771 [Coniferiporia weirii]|nr:hypothetical protein M0805_008771 [Coniferiporia weirii]